MENFKKIKTKTTRLGMPLTLVQKRQRSPNVWQHFSQWHKEFGT